MPVTRQRLCQALDLVEQATADLVGDRTFDHRVLIRLRQWRRPDDLVAFAKKIIAKASAEPRTGAGMNGVTLDKGRKPSLESLVLHYAEEDADLFEPDGVAAVRKKFAAHGGPLFHGPWA